MAKDPAFLFYPGDYLRDTQCLSPAAQVAYDRIMCEHMRNICISHAQLKFFTKRLTDDEREEVMAVLKEVDGCFQIEWVAESICKRKDYSESRRKNRSAKSKLHMSHISSTYVEHMENENENENEDINKDKNNKGKPKKPKFISPTIDEVVKFFEEHGYTNGDKAWNYYNDGDWKDSKGNPVVSWKQKMRMVWFKDENKKQPTEHEKLAQANRERWQRERERFEQLHK